MRLIRNQKGQGLIEYLVIVALMGVATIAIVRTMGQAVSSRFANVTFALQGQTKRAKTIDVDDGNYKKRDLGDFFAGAASKDGTSSESP